MKNLLLINILFIISVFTLSCNKNIIEIKDKYNTDYTMANIITFGDDTVLDLSLYNNNIYYISGDSVKRLSIQTNKQEEIISGVSQVKALYVSKDGIYVYETLANKILLYDFNANLINECVIDKLFDVDLMTVNNNDVILKTSDIINNTRITKIYLIDFNTGKLTYLDKLPLVYINSVCFYDSQNILVTANVNKNIAFDDTKIYLYNINKNEITYEYPISGGGWAGDYNSVKDQYIYIEQLEIRKYTMGGEDINTVKLLDEYKINNCLADNGQSGGNYSRIPQKVFYTGDNVFIWNKSNNIVLIEDLKNSDNAVKILLPNKDSVIAYELKSITNEFTAEYGIDVEFTVYDESEYLNKLRIKLLANDNDFDIFFLQDVTEDRILANILSNNIYEPLENYNNIVANFDNINSYVKKAMTYNDNIFGLPQTLNFTAQAYTDTYYNYISEDVNFKIDKDWTIGNLFELCEYIHTTDRNISVFSDVSSVFNMSCNFIESTFKTKTFNSTTTYYDALYSFLSNIKKYQESGILYAVDNNPSLLQFGIMFNTLKLNEIENQILSYPRAEKNSYQNIFLNSCYLMNKFSVNKENAAVLLEYLLSDKCIYKPYLFSGFFGMDISQYKTADGSDLFGRLSKKSISIYTGINDIYDNPSVYLTDIRALCEEDFMKMISGESSPKDTADAIYRTLSYLLNE